MARSHQRGVWEDESALRCAWEVKVLTQCVLEGPLLLVFEAESEDSQRRRREAISSNAGDYLLERNGHLSIINKQFSSKKIRSLSNQLLQLKQPTNCNIG